MVVRGFKLKELMKAFLKQILKAAARQSVGRLPQPASRLTGTLAKHGGKPVRDIRFRPWPNYHSNNLLPWLLSLRPAMRKVFLTGVEGLPQPLAKDFAQRWAEYCGCRYGLLLPHGTDALRIALAAALDLDGLDYGGEVIVPNLSFIATATAALDRRVGVVFVDVDPDTLLIDPDRVEEAIVPGKTRAIMPVHLFGQPADMRALCAIAARYGLKVIEDAAQAHGAALNAGPVGSFGDAAGFSFQSTKNLTSGEGGALTTNDQEIFERAYSMHDAGRARIGGERWGHVTLGWNCRPTEYQAAVLLERLKAFDRQQERRQQNAEALREMVADVSCIEPLMTHSRVSKHGMHMFVMRYRPDLCDGLRLPDFLDAVQAEGAPIYRAYAATMAGQPAIQKLMAKRPEYFRCMATPVADQATSEIIYVPQNVLLGSKTDMIELAASLRKVQKHFAPKAQPVTARTMQSGSRVNASAVVAGRAEVTEATRPLRFGVIGVGIMGQTHAEVISHHSMLMLAGVTDLNPEGKKLAQSLGCKWFDNPQQLISSGEVDAVTIATPHWQHAELSIAAMRAGIHVICEKPLSVTVGQADAIVAASRQSHRLFAVVHQSRFEPAYRDAKEIIASGELGPILRCSMVETVWRSQRYYKSSRWRGTWRGEGGGVLLNQAPHVLDRYAWLVGMPETVSGHCTTTLHDIEVEDSASAVLRHSGGMHGHIHVSTNECPAVAQTVISCDRGRIIIEDGVMRVTRLDRSIRQATQADSRYWGDIEGQTRQLGGGLVSSIPQLLGLFYENIALAAAGKVDLVCPGEQGVNAVEIASGIILSSMTGREVRFPVNRKSYEELIEELSVKSIPASA